MNPNLNTGEVLLILVGLGLLTVLTRGAFLLSEREVPIPGWLREALRHAPLAAVAAIVVPEVITVQGVLIDTWQDARPAATAVGVALYLWKRNMLLTIVGGTATLLTLRLGFGWA